MRGSKPVEEQPEKGVHPVGFSGAATGKPASRVKKVKRIEKK